MSAIQELYDCIKNLEKEDGFEEFDDFYDKVMAKEILFGMEDIQKICLIFKDKDNIMEPHNYISLERMTFITIDNCGIERGFDELIRGIIKIADINPVESKGYMNMLMNGYSKDDIDIFAKLLKKYNKEDRKKIGEFVSELIDARPEIYSDKGSIILSAV